MSPSRLPLRLLAGRLSVDFVNTIPANAGLSWDRLIGFLEASHIATPERARELLALSHSDPQANHPLSVLHRAVTLYRKVDVLETGRHGRGVACDGNLYLFAHWLRES